MIDWFSFWHSIEMYLLLISHYTVLDKQYRVTLTSTHSRSTVLIVKWIKKALKLAGKFVMWHSSRFFLELSLENVDGCEVFYGNLITHLMFAAGLHSYEPVYVVKLVLLCLGNIPSHSNVVQ